MVLEFLANNSAVLAAGAATIGIPILVWQIAQSGLQERRRLKRRHLAAQATLTMTLTGIIEWAEQAARALEQIYSWAKGNRGKPAPPFDPPRMPSDLIAAIERMVEASPKGRVAKILAAIVSDIQTLGSRMRGMADHGEEEIRANAPMMDDNLIMAASIYARAESLYDYARGPSENAPLDYSRVSAAMNFMNMRDHRYPDTHNEIMRLRRRARPWRERTWEAIKRKWQRWQKGNDQPGS